MPNPIADPLVENLDTDTENPSVRIEATEAGAVTVWIDRPGRRNALDSLTVAALHEAFETLRGAEGVRIVFLRGAGGEFSDGADREGLRLSLDLSEDDHRQNALAEAAMLKGLSDIPAFTVALVEGAAIGLGAGLVAACDMAAATADARFGFCDVRDGLVAASVIPYLAEAVGPRAARGLLARGDTFDAAHAEEIGLVQHALTTSAALEAFAAELADEARGYAVEAVAGTKAATRRLAGRPIDHALMAEAAHIEARSRMSDEGREGVAARIEGRKARWSSGAQNPP